VRRLASSRFVLCAAPAYLKVRECRVFRMASCAMQIEPGLQPQSLKNGNFQLFAADYRQFRSVYPAIAASHVRD
jgi:hypothetical protein